MPAVRLFCSDLDGTLLGDFLAAQRFVRAWESLPVIRRPLLVFSSGRSVANIQSLIDWRCLPAADYLIGGGGTELYNARAGHLESGFAAQFERGWDPAKVEEILRTAPGVERRPPVFLHPYKLSWHLHHAQREQIDEFRRQFEEAGLDVTVIYSSRRDLDVLPRCAGKGSALAWLCRHLGVSLEQTLVAGDTSNDSGMFLLPGVRRIVVKNAQPELLETVASLPVYAARRILADGVLEGLIHFGVISADDSTLPAGNVLSSRGAALGSDGGNRV